MTGLNRPLSEATGEGHRVALAVLLLCLGVAVAVSLQGLLAGRWQPASGVRLAYGGALLAAAIGVVAVVVVGNW